MGCGRTKADGYALRKNGSDPDTSMPTFNRVGAGWINGVKILKYKDDPLLTWVKEVVVKL